MAKKTISTLNIKVTASAEGVRKGLSKAKGELKGFGKSGQSAVAGLGAKFKALAGSLKGVVKGIKIAVAVFGALAVNTLRVATAMESAALVATRLNATTAEIIALRSEASKLGASASTLDMSLQRMVRRIAEAAIGAGEAKDALKELNLNAAELSNMTATQQFKAIADAMQKVANKGDRVRLAMKLFDSEGVALLGTLEKLSGEGLKEAAERADRLSLTLSKIDLRNLNDAKEASNDLVDALRGLGNQLGAAFGPAVTTLVQAMADAVERTTLAFQNLRVNLLILGGHTREEARKIVFAVTKIKEVAKETAKAIEDTTAAVSTAAEALRDKVASIVEASKSPMEKLKDEIRSVGEVWSDIPFERHGAVIDSLAKKWESILGPIKAIDKTVRGGRTFGGVVGSAGGIAAVNEAARNRRAQIAKARAEADAARKGDERHEVLLRKIHEELETTRRLAPPPATIKKISIVG